jgi:hypothetical protein
MVTKKLYVVYNILNVEGKPYGKPFVSKYIYSTSKPFVEKIGKKDVKDYNKHMSRDFVKFFGVKLATTTQKRKYLIAKRQYERYNEKYTGKK